MNETSKAHGRRMCEGWFRKYVVGKGIDICCGDDPINSTCDRWDLQNGDAQFMAGVKPEKYDWVYSSHGLEHMVDPYVAVNVWWRLVKPGGHLLIAVPDEDLYEQGIWPSEFNGDHKWTFTVGKSVSWSEKSINLADMLGALPGSKIISVATIDSGYDYRRGVWDRTVAGGEAAIEAVVQKVMPVVSRSHNPK